MDYDGQRSNSYSTTTLKEAPNQSQMNPADIGLNSSNTNNKSTIHPIFDEMPEDFTVGDYFTSIGIGVKPARTPWQDPNRKRSGKPRPPPGRKPTVFWPAAEVVQTRDTDQQHRKRKISTEVVAISPLDAFQIAGTSADAEVFEQDFAGPSTSQYATCTPRLLDQTLNVSISTMSNDDINNSIFDLTQPARSWWRYFQKMKAENLAICLSCGQAFNRGAKQSTTSLSHHLKMYHRNLYIAVQKARDEHAQYMAYEKGSSQKNGHKNSSFNLDESAAHVHNNNNSFEQMPAVRRLIHAVRKFPQLYENMSTTSSGGNGQVQDEEEMDEIWAKVKEMVDPKNPNVKNEPTDQKEALHELRRRWNNLCEKFRKELRFVVRDYFAYKPKWPHFKELTWLAAHIEGYKHIAHLLDEFVCDKPVVKSLDDLLLPMDFHEVLNQQDVQSSSFQAENPTQEVPTKRRHRKREMPSTTNSLPIEEKLLKQELDESELREVATVLGIDISSVQNGGLSHELDDVDTSFLMDQNGCCPSREAIQTIGYMLMNNGTGCGTCNGDNDNAETADGNNNDAPNGCCNGEEGNKTENKSEAAICGCNCTKIESSSEDEDGIGQNEREFGREVARKLAKIEGPRREKIKAEIQRMLDMNPSMQGDESDIIEIRD